MDKFSLGSSILEKILSLQIQSTRDVISWAYGSIVCVFQASCLYSVGLNRLRNCLNPQNTSKVGTP